MFYKATDDNYINVLEGFKRKTLTYGKKTLLIEMRLEGGRRVPAHSHPHEQIGYLISGRLMITMGNEIFKVEPGDSWCIPGDVEHGAEVLEDAVAIEVFVPVREEFLP